MTMRAFHWPIGVPALLAIALDAGCHDARRADAGASAPVISLQHSIRPLADHFNAGADRHRFVALLSPT